MGYRIPRSIVLLALAALLAAPAHAQTPDAGWGDWEIAITPYLWFFNLKGDIGARGQKTDVDTSLIDLFENNDSVLGIEANMQARNGPWTLLVDPTWLRVQDDLHFSGDLGASASVDVTADTYLIDLMVLREVWHLPFGAPVVEKGMPRHGLTLDLLGGTRVWVLDMDADLDVATPGPILDQISRSFSQTESWADPVVGARASVDLTDRIHAILRGDIGGFTVSSDLTSEIWGSLVYDFGLFGHKAHAALGYRALYVDYDANGGFLLDAWMHGPTIGVGMTF
jgi:hypothetical protein